VKGLMAPGRLLAPPNEMRRHSWISYWRHGRRWIIWVIATVIAVANLYVMVFKP
jgi:hypothetical protein